MNTTVVVTPGGDDGGSPAGGCASFYQDGVYLGNVCSGPTASGGPAAGGGGGSGKTSVFMMDPTVFTSSVLGSIKFQVETNLIASFCKDKESTRILTSMRNGAIFGAGRGAYTGFTSGEAVGGTVTFGTSGLAGAAGGTLVGGLVGSIMGFAHGAIAGQVCKSSGWYN